jgi:hypothetical protein
MGWRLTLIYHWEWEPCEAGVYQMSVQAGPDVYGVHAISHFSIHVLSILFDWLPYLEPRVFAIR